jgi:predicted nucleic acid-binding protein
MNLFLDANVLFTAVYSSAGISRALFDLAEAGCCSLCTSAFALEEARRNLSLKAPDRLPDIERLSGRITVVPEPAPDKVAWAQTLPLPSKDAPVMAAAAACGANVLVTGDRLHFGHLLGREVEEILVLSPREALEKVLEQTTNNLRP